MNKKKIRGLGFLILVLSLCFPMIIVSLQDFHDINKEISLEDSQTEDILKNHPVIESIYKYYQTTSEDTEEYVIKRIGEYSLKKQDKLKQYQTLFSTEIQKLLNKKVVSRELLEYSDQEYQADYGTMIISKNLYNLNQILRMWQESFKSFQYQMDPQTHKIIGFSLSQEPSLNLTEDQMKSMAWGMVEYLELDDIDDWSYNQYGYESNKAKLRVSCELEKRVNTNDINIRVSLLGVLNSRIYGKVIQ